MSKLTPRQAKFVRLVLKGTPHGKAAKEAGYSAKRCDSQASTLMGKPQVVAALEAGRARVAEIANVDAAKVLRWLEEHRELSVRLKDVAPANRAAELIGKQLGMFVERKEVDIGDRLAKLFDDLADADADD